MSEIGPVLRAYASRTAGGGGGGVGNVEWGPDFGEPNGADGTTIELTRPTLDLDSLVLHADLAAAATVDLEQLALAATLDPTVSIDGSALGAPFWQSVGLFEGTQTTGTTVTVPKPSGTAAGDLLLAHVAISQLNSGLPVTPPSGWTLIQSGSTGVTILSAATFWKIAGASEPADYTFTFSGTGGNVPRCGEIHRFIATDPTTPVNVSAVATTTTAADPVSPTVTTTATNCLVVAFLAHDHGTVAQTHTPAASHVERSDYDGTNGTLLVAGHMMQRVFAATGATGTATHDCTEVVASAAVMTRIAIAPTTLDLVP